ncbi:bromodomain adjacent to zinc finger domain protein 2B [Clonorchis sinensis]|uniref:Bromodomain adjacent to zinc finger domain protein 2B n=1 Tax=Clonorchis sinensis TaxID=79923 RepID=G7YCQ3_CLOSI|nr:bromodomain adjacent to zinc finger domain protein 2B [Clonorchis sinensis]
MTSQTRNSYPQPPGGSADSTNDSELLPGYFGLNYAQQAALLWANAAAMAAAASSSTSSTGLSPQEGTTSQRNPKSSSSTSMNTFESKQSSLQPKSNLKNASNKEYHTDKTSTSSAYGSATSGHVDPTTMMLAGRFTSPSVENRMKENNLSLSTANTSDTQCFAKQSSAKSDPRTTDSSKRPEDTDNSGCLNPETILANQMLQSLAGAQMTYQRQVKQQQQHQQQASMALAAALSREASLSGFPPGYLESFLTSASARTGGALDSTSRADSAGAATNLAYVRAMMMAIAAACGGMKGASGSSLAGQSNLPTVPLPPILSGGMNYELPTFGSFGSSGNGPHQSTSVSSPSCTGPTESFNDVLTFLSQCLNTPKPSPDRTPNHLRTPLDPKPHSMSTSSPIARRSGRAGSNSRTRGGSFSGSAQSATWEQPVPPSPTRHRGRGRPPKSAAGSMHYQNSHKQSSHMTTSCAPFNSQDEHESYKPSSSETTTNVYGRRPSSTTSANECSVDDTIDEVLRYLAACDHDPAIVANRYASSALGIALNRKRRKEPGTSTASSSALVGLPLTNTGYRGEPGELYMHSGNKRIRTSTSADSNLRRPLALGWRRETLVKGIGPGGILGEVIYVTPCGRRLWNLDSIREYLKSNNGNKLSVDDFSFKSYLRLGDYYECSRSGQAPQSYVKMSDAALDALMTTAGIAEMTDSKNTPGNLCWPAISQAENIEATQHIPGDLCPSSNVCTSNQPILPPVAHMNSTVASKSIYNFPSNLYDPANSDLNYTAYLGSSLTGDSLSVPPVAHSASQSMAINPSAIPFLDPYSSHSGLNSFTSPLNHPLVSGSTSTVNNPWSPINRPMSFLPLNTCMPGVPSLTGLDPTMERDCMKQFFVQLAEEQLRLNKEKKAHRQKVLLEQREQLLALKVSERMEYELKKPVDDLRLLNLKPLPKLDPIEGNRLSSQAFSDCLLVVEFLHAFTEILCVDSETIPTMGMLQAALIDRDPACQQAVLHLLIELLKFAILDPGLPSSRLVTQLLGQRFSELEVNPSTVTGLLRVFLIGRNGYEDDMSDWLRPPCHFTELSSDQQSALLAFVCDELVCSSRLISTEVDRTIELQAALRREKWVLESKIRRLRFVMARKFGVTGTNDTTPVDQLLQNTSSIRGSTARNSAVDGSNEPCGVDIAPNEATQSPGIAGDKKESERLDSSSRSTEKDKPECIKSEESKPIFYFEDMSETSASGAHEFCEKTANASASTGGEAAPNASATAAAAVSAAAIMNAFLVKDEEDVEDVNELEAKIDTLVRVVEHKQRAIEECSFRLSGLYLGQDRFFRRYYVLGHSGGIYIQGNADAPNEPLSCEEKVNSDDENGTGVKADGSDFAGEVDLRFGFDPDQLVAEIQARRRLAEKRRYTIVIPNGHGITHPHHQPNNQGPSSHVQQSMNEEITSNSELHECGEAQEGKISGELLLETEEPSTVNDSQSTPLAVHSEMLTDGNFQANQPSSRFVTSSSDKQFENGNGTIHKEDNFARPGTLITFISDEEYRRRAQIQTSCESIRNDTQLNGNFTGNEIKTEKEDSGICESQESTENGLLHPKPSPSCSREDMKSFAEELSENFKKDKEEYPTSSPKKDNMEVEMQVAENECKKLDTKTEAAHNEIKRLFADTSKEAKGQVVAKSDPGGSLHEPLAQKCNEQSLTELHTTDNLDCASDTQAKSVCGEVEKTLHQPFSEAKESTENFSGSSVSTGVPKKSGATVETMETCENPVSVQPLDLSTKSTTCLPCTNSSKDTGFIPESGTLENIYELMTSLGLDDVVLTTAALLFMTHSSIIPASVACNETLYEPWKSLIAHYKSILIWALMEEIRTNPTSEDEMASPVPEQMHSTHNESAAPQSLRDAVLVLKKSFVDNASSLKFTDMIDTTRSHQYYHREQRPSKVSSADDEADLVMAISDSEVEQVTDQGLLTRNIQLTSSSGVERNKAKSTQWCRLTSPSKLRTMIQALAPRGVRERNLAKGIRQSEEVVEPSLQVAANLNDELNYTKNGTEVELEPRFLRVRSRRGKGRGSTGTNAQFSTSSSFAGLNAISSSRLGLNPTHSETSFLAPISHSSCCSSQEQGIDPTSPALVTDPSDSAEASIQSSGIIDQSGSLSSSSIILEHRLRRRVSRKTTPTSDSAGSLLKSVVARLEKRPGVHGLKTTDAQANGRSLVELIGSDDPNFVEECCFLEEIESLEDRVLAASLQVKGWQAPVKVLDDEMVHLIPRSTPKRSRFEQWPLDLAKSRLLTLEHHLERRYLLPPLNSEVHLDIVPESDSNLPSDLHRSFNETADPETGSESGFGGGPGSESTTNSLKDCDSTGATGNLPQIRRVVGKQASGSEGIGAASTVHSTQCLAYSHPSDIQDSTNFLLGAIPSETPPPGLVEWRLKLHRATEIEAMRECMNQLINAIAWEKSIMKVLCQICRKDSNEAQLLLCDGCDHGYHTYCFRPPLVDIPPGDWFCYDCVSKATGRQVCFVCGGCVGKPISSVASLSSCPELMSRLLVCEQCSRTVHPCCSRPPMTRPPRRWVCANCTSHQGSVSSQKVNKTPTNTNNCLLDTDTSSASCSSPVNRIARNPDMGSSSNSMEALSLSTKNKKGNLNSLKTVKPLSEIGATKTDACSSAFAKRLKSTNTARSSGFVTKLKQQCKNRVRLKGVRCKEDSKLVISTRDYRREYNRRKQRGRVRPAIVGAITSNATDCGTAHSVGEELSVDSSSHQSGRDSLGGSEYVFGQEDETPRKLLSPTELAWCRMVTKDLINHQASWAFRKPVNLKQVPFYRKIIKHPMDLSTIYKKTRQACAYSTIDEWRRDVRLIFDNCEIFNEDDSEVGRAGHTMRAYFESRWCQPSNQPCSSIAVAQLVKSGLSTTAQPPDVHIQTPRPNSPSDIILARLKESVNSSSNCVDQVTDASDVKALQCQLETSQTQSSNTSDPHYTDLLPQLPSPAHSDYSDGRSSGFSGFEQNECMMGLQLDDLNSPVLTSIEPETAPVPRTQCDRESAYPTLPSEVCLPTTTVSSPL